jgi:hypothetical protein
VDVEEELELKLVVVVFIRVNCVIVVFGVVILIQGTISKTVSKVSLLSSLNTSNIPSQSKSKMSSSYS